MLVRRQCDLQLDLFADTRRGALGQQQCIGQLLIANLRHDYFAGLRRNFRVVGLERVVCFLKAHARAEAGNVKHGSRRALRRGALRTDYHRGHYCKENRSAADQTDTHVRSSSRTLQLRFVLLGFFDLLLPEFLELGLPPGGCHLGCPPRQRNIHHLDGYSLDDIRITEVADSRVHSDV